MKVMKTALCLLALLLLTALPVLAADHQYVSLTTDENGVYFAAGSENGQEPIWNIPTLQAGERLLEPGTLTLRNLTDEDARIALDYVELPFGDEDSLIYLNHLTITVRDGDDVLYSGPYSRINDAGGLAFEYTLAPNEAKTLTVDLRRDYAMVALDGLTKETKVTWRFVNVKDVIIDPNTSAPSQTVTTPSQTEPVTQPSTEPSQTPSTKPTSKPSAAPTSKPSTVPTETFDDPALAQVFLAAVAAAAVLAVVFLVRRRRER